MNHCLRSYTLGAMPAILMLFTACRGVVQQAAGEPRATGLRPVDCPPKRPKEQSAIAWQLADTAGIAGSIVVIGTLAPANGAGVTLTPVSDSGQGRPRVTVSNHEGRFRFDSAPPASYLLYIRRIGYAPVSETIYLRGDSGAVVTAVLATRTMMLDGYCSTVEGQRTRYCQCL